MSLASDPSQRRHLLPQAVFATLVLCYAYVSAFLLFSSHLVALKSASRISLTVPLYFTSHFYHHSKIRFLRLETFGELAPYMWGSMRFWITLLMFLFTFWLRLYVHYVAQYMYLQVSFRITFALFFHFHFLDFLVSHSSDNSVL